MSAPQQNNHQLLIRQRFPLDKVLIAAAAYQGVEYFGPLYSQVYDSYVLDVPATLCLLIGAASVFEVAEWSLNHLAERIEDILAKIPVGLKAAVHPFARWSDVKHLAPRWEDGPYWGVFKRSFWFRNREIIKHVTSVAWVNGPSGSGKTTRLLQNSVLTTFDSKYIVDFKGDLTHVLYKPLHERGEHIIVLDLAQDFADHPEIPSDSFNPLNMVSDCFFQKDGILDVRTMAVELVGQLYPDKDAGSHDPFWPNSAKGVILLVILYVILLHGEAGHLGHMEALIADGDALCKNMLWVCGKLVGSEDQITPPMPLEQSPWAMSGLHKKKDITNFIDWFRRRAKALAKMLSETDKKMAESFLTSAQVQLADYAMTGRAFKAI
ncbi:MAG: type IV secretory system conjugative DNA transfer family protein, partial [Rickettsiales bacterium]|nr:type IV secretory system conjugative DNA transfer family protein [Rickettsiales bacterium]